MRLDEGCRFLFLFAMHCYIPLPFSFFRSSSSYTTLSRIEGFRMMRQTRIQRIRFLLSRSSASSLFLFHLLLFLSTATSSTHSLLSRTRRRGQRDPSLLSKTSSSLKGIHSPLFPSFLPLTPSQLNRVPCIMVPIHKTTPSILEQSLYHPSRTLQIVQPRPLQQAHDQHSDSHQLLKIHYVSTHHRAL